jgi:hypothetical protein
MVPQVCFRSHHHAREVLSGLAVYLLSPKTLFRQRLDQVVRASHVS